MQVAFHIKDGKEFAIWVPDANENLFDSVKWGKLEKFFTPAYWYVQTCFMSFQNASPLQYKLGKSFEEEVVACLLGGYGIPSEVGNAKFKQLQQTNIFQRKQSITYQEIEEMMLLPIVHNGKEKKYRFAKQKARYIYDALKKINRIDEKRLSDKELRNYLLGIKGIGPKTASWIVRNYRDSDRVAILDIHLYRAGLLAGFFSKNDKVEKNYFEMEDRYLLFAKKLGVRASKLDAVIWWTMKELNSYVLRRILNI